MGQLVFGLLIGFVIFILPLLLFIGGIVWSTEKPIRGYLLSVVGAVWSLAIWGESFGLEYQSKSALVTTAVLCGVACVIFCIGDKISKIRDKKKIYAFHQPLLAPTPFSEKHNEYPEMFAKATADYEYIASVIPKIKNEEIAFLTKELHQVATDIFDYLDDIPERMPIAKEFVNYYQDRTAQLLRQYSALKGGRSEALAKLERDMITTFRGFLDAYNKEFDKVIDADIMDMDAEMKVARQIMNENGINCEARIDYDDIHKNLPEKVKKDLPKPEDTKDSGINFKYVGLAAGAVLGVVVGAYKFFGNKKDDKS